jgi:hypothetical protein
MPNLDYHEILFLHILGCDVRIECRDADAVDLLIANYGQMQVDQSARADLDYTVSRCRKKSGLRIARRDGEPLVAADDCDFLFLFEKDLTIELQKLRRDLYFVHAAALGYSGRAFLLVAASGNGKSTTTWALLHHGFGYLSDELGPLNLDHLEVQPYPHALCLKKEPPWPYSLPDETLRTASTLHIPTVRLPNATISKPLPLTALFFLEYRPGLNSPGVHQLSKAEAAARFFTHALNPLAHAQDGLAGAAAVAQNIPSFCLDSGDLSLTCGLIKKTLEKAAEDGRSSVSAADHSAL